MNKSIAGAIAAIFIGTAGAAYAEAEYTLVISSWVPPTHNINTQMLPNMIEMIEEATDGRVTGEVRLGLAPPPRIEDPRNRFSLGADLGLRVDRSPDDHRDADATQVPSRGAAQLADDGDAQRRFDPQSL